MLCRKYIGAYTGTWGYKENRREGSGIVIPCIGFLVVTEVSVP